LPFGNTLSIDISTILSLATLIPVVSRSKKQMGFLKFNFMGKFCSAKVLNTAYEHRNAIKKVFFFIVSILKTENINEKKI
jgi:hypothetical protein